MDKLVVPTPSNGFPLNNDDIRFLLGLAPYSDGIYQALEGMLAAYGTDLIVSGCGVAGSNIAEGWVLIGGVLVKVDAHTATNNYFEIVTTYNANGQKQTQTGGLADAYQQNRATATAASGTLASPVSGNPETFPKSKILDLIRADSDFEATTSNKGVLETSTPSEAQGFSSTTTMTTPSNFADIRATTSQAEGFSITTRFLTPENLQHIRADSSETTARSTSTRFISPSTMGDIESWTNITPGGSFTGTFRVRIDNVGNIHLHCELTKASIQSSSVVLGTLTSGFRPAQDIQIVASSSQTGIGDVHIILIDDSTGIITFFPLPDNFEANSYLRFYCVFR